MLWWTFLGAAAGIAALAARRALGGYPPAPGAYRTLSRREVATVEAAATATFPAGGEVQPSGLDAGVPLHVDRFVGAQRTEIRLLMRLLFVLVEHATLVFPAPGRGGRRRFSSLSLAQQIAALDGWRSSRLFPRRLVFTSLRAILTMGYFADPAVLRELGLAPRAIPHRVAGVDFLWPRIGESRATLSGAPTFERCAGPGVPLGPQGPLHPDYEAPGEIAAR